MPLDFGTFVEWLKSGLEMLRQHWHSIAGTGATLLAAAWVWWRARLAWHRRRFLHRINFSLNYIEGGTLRFRTLQESDVREILLNNTYAVKLLMRAVGRTTLDQPLVELPERDAWIMLNSVLNELSEQFAQGFLARSMGLPVCAEQYVFAITCEKDPDVRVNKVRVMIIAESLLDRIEQMGQVAAHREPAAETSGPPPLQQLKFERPHHRVRLDTLRKMAEFRRDKSRSHNLLRMELILPAITSQDPISMGPACQTQA